jgi:hypothetical protein
MLVVMLADIPQIMISAVGSVEAAAYVSMAGRTSTMGYSIRY